LRDAEVGNSEQPCKACDEVEAEEMTEEEALNKMKEAVKLHDTEMAHGDADDILCDLLVSLGYVEVVNEYHKVDKWYA